MGFYGVDYPVTDEQLLMDHIYLDDGLGDGLVPPDPFATPANEINEKFQRRDVDAESDGDETEDKGDMLLELYIENIGLGIGILIGALVQMATLAGSAVNVAIWGAEDASYARATFVFWCLLMSAMFFVAFALLRGLVQMSLRMVINSNRQAHQQEIRMAVDVPTNFPTPSPTVFPRIGRSCTCDGVNARSNQGTTVGRDQHKVLDDVLRHMKLNYVLGVSIGMSLSWIVTNSALGHHGVSLIFSLLPALLGLAWFYFMKWSGATGKQFCCCQQNHEDA